MTARSRSDLEDKGDKRMTIRLREDYVDGAEATRAAKLSKRAAIRKSEEKWESVVRGLLEGKSANWISSREIGIGNCALCIRYKDTDVDGNCVDSKSLIPCPLRTVRNGQCIDIGSIYGKYGERLDAYRRVEDLGVKEESTRRRELIAAALRMLNTIRKVNGKKKLLVSELKKVCKP